jgi:hypothetical protein
MELRLGAKSNSYLKERRFRRYDSAKADSPIDLGRVRNCRRAFLLNLFRQVWPRMVERFTKGDAFIEIR